MGLRITTWNVNGIRNPFGYQPWRDRRTFDGMFDILEADIVIMQELKIQKKDLRDDMVLVPGWDCYFSLPVHKKGYSGVGIYTRNAVCAPIRAEEGVLGVLCPPNSSIAYCDLPEHQHIGGYLSDEQLEALSVDATFLDSEGRCVVLEFPAFVIFGIYSPANSSGTRDDFRYGFLNALDTRIRNLVAEGKRVIVTGDLNVSRSEADTAGAADSMRKEGITHEQYISTPNRRIFNQLLEGGEVVGERDPGRENPVLWDVCRSFHPDRTGMFTHWEQKINARPGNFGSRIDFILCSLDMKSWFSNSDIQEGLMGSDHCPVYAVVNDTVNLRGTDKHLKDIMNPQGVFEDGVRIKEYSEKNVPAFSGKLLKEFFKRRNIKDMFGKKPSLPHDTSSMDTAQIPERPQTTAPTARSLEAAESTVPATDVAPDLVQDEQNKTPIPSQASRTASPEKKRKASESTRKAAKKPKAGTKAITEKSASNGQQSLKGFFQSKSSKSQLLPDVTENVKPPDSKLSNQPHDPTNDEPATPISPIPPTTSPYFLTPFKSQPSPLSETMAESKSPTKFVDPIVSKESWSKMFTKPTAPRCEHGEPCKTMKTRKAGFNCGRDFWMCQRPLGPSGNKEHGTQWRCGTFIWSSDWNGTHEQKT